MLTIFFQIISNDWSQWSPPVKYVFDIVRSIVAQNVYRKSFTLPFDKKIDPNILFAYLTDWEYEKLQRKINFFVKPLQFTAHRQLTSALSPWNTYAYSTWHYPWSGRTQVINVLYEFKNVFGFQANIHTRQNQAYWYDLLTWRSGVPYTYDYHFKNHMFHHHHTVRFGTFNTPKGVWTVGRMTTQEAIPIQDSILAYQDAFWTFQGKTFEKSEYRKHAIVFIYHKYDN